MGGSSRTQHRSVSFSALLFFVFLALPGYASVEGRVAAAKVSEASYRHFLDDMLFTHDGDERTFGPQHDLARDNIADLMTSWGLTVTLEPFVYGYPEPDSVYYNVVGEKLGATRPTEIYIVGAHFDSYYTPGADDNASGTAMVLEAARVLSAYDSEATLRFIAFDREEQWMVGSYAYADDHFTDDIRGMISADMIAYNPGIDIVNIWNSSLSAMWASGLVQAGEDYTDFWNPSALIWHLAGMLPFCDHWPFEEAGFQACGLEENDFYGNMNYHELTDSVDTPGYIDYAFSTKITRGVVGYLADVAGVGVEIHDADFNTDGVVDSEDSDAFASCFTGPEIAPADPDCLFFDYEPDGDIDCDDWRVFGAVWNQSPFPPVLGPCADLPPTVGTEGGRYLTITAPEGGIETALLVSGDPNDAAVACVSAYVQPDGSLGPMPVFQTPETWGTVFVSDENILPGTTYQAQSDFGTIGSPALSSPVSITTEVWGDTVGMFDGTVWTPPDGDTGIIDVVAILDGFIGLTTAPPLQWIDLVGVGGSGIDCAPDQSIDIIDALGALDAFKGLSFSESAGCPPPCEP